MRVGALRSAPLCDVVTTVASVLPYSVFSRVVQNHAGCELVAQSLSVTTPELRWANAVELPPHPGATVLPAGLALTLHMLVHDGEIGIGLLTADGEYGDEVRVGAGGEAERVDIVLPAGASLGSLLVRNTSAGGASRANIEIVGS